MYIHASRTSSAPPPHMLLHCHPLQRQTLVPAFWTGSQGLIPCANTSNAFFWKTSSCAHWVFYNCQVVLLTATLIKRVWLRWWMARPAGWAAPPNWRSSLMCVLTKNLKCFWNHDDFNQACKDVTLKQTSKIPFIKGMTDWTNWNNCKENFKQYLGHW